jgi:O-antigen/teichoic acid export membrane protein
MKDTLSRRTLVVDTLVTQVGRVLQIAFSIATIVVLARALGPVQFGVFSTIVAVQTACFALADLGFGQLALRAVAQRRPAEATAIRNAMPWLYLSSSSILLVSSTVAVLFVSGNVKTAIISLLIGASYMHTPARIGVERGFWLGAMKFGPATSIDVFAAGMRALGVGLVWLVGGASLLGFAIGFAISGPLTVFGVRQWLSYPGTDPGSPSSYGPKLLFKEGAPFALSSLTWNTFAELPKILLAPSAGLAAVGQFAAGARFLVAAYVPLQSLMLVMTPRLFAFAGSSSDQRQASAHPLLRAVAVTTTAGGLLALMIAACAPLLPRLLGAQYQPAVPILRMLSVSLPFQALAFATGDWLGGVGKQHLRLMLTLVMAVLSIPVLLIASSSAGALGAAAGYSSLTAALALATAAISRRYLHR